MAQAKNNQKKKPNNGANVGYEAELWQMADACTAAWMPPRTHQTHRSGHRRSLRITAEAMLRQTQDEGKAMIVCMSRRICVDLYREIIKLRPNWHDENDEKGVMKVIMTGSASDPVDWQKHIRNKTRREELANRFRNPADSFKIAIVRDMWFTGFDAPSHTMYVDKPMRGHGLMQAIARVNRGFREKPGGLVVDYPGMRTS
jgi:type I site-specific restriction-modification system R (restriction) subunit